MYVRIRQITSNSKEDDLVVNITKTALIEDLRKLIQQRLDIPNDNQKLYYKGKLLIDNHTVVDYDIRLNDVIQLMISKNDVKDKSPASTNSAAAADKDEDTIDVTSPNYKVGDRIDFVDGDHGAWFEAKIIRIYVKRGARNDVFFTIKEDRLEDLASFDVKSDVIRPRARYVYDKSELKPGMLVLANYHPEKPKEIGYWYDFEISKVSSKKLEGTILAGKDKVPLQNVSVKLLETMRIEKPTLLSERTYDFSDSVTLRKLPVYCPKCKDDLTKKCKYCGCTVCHLKTSPKDLMLCDQCDNGYHKFCLDPPLTAIPTDEWYCPECKTDSNEIVQAGEKLKPSRKKEKMISNKNRESTSSSSKDWGKGMACVGRTTECTIVPKDHYGPIPGIDVGTCWKYRLQVSEAGVHRPHVAGIHGRENDGAYSIVLSGGYEDDIDYGDEFYYTGSGGRDLSGNKRVNNQSCDQKLTKMNKALALNCNVEFDDECGGEAKDWKNGKPVRVVRNYHLAKHSKYAPEDGNRYDGIYKVVKYYPERGKSGFVIWRYFLKRDDPAPAPWTKKGQQFEMLYPPGYLEAQAQKLSLGSSPSSTRKSKRKLQVSPNKTNSITNYLSPPSSPTKRMKIQPYSIPKDIKTLIVNDEINEKVWMQCLDEAKNGKQKFLNKVEEVFMCVCCQEVVHKPITTTCKHNICKGCLKRSFSAEIFLCPYCRFSLGADYSMDVNLNLGGCLKLLFPGYESGR